MSRRWIGNTKKYEILKNGAGNLFVWVFKFSISAENNIIPLNSNVVFYAVSLKMY